MHDKYCRAGRALAHSHHDAQLAEMMVARYPIPVATHTADAHLGQVKPCKDRLNQLLEEWPMDLRYCLVHSTLCGTSG